MSDDLMSEFTAKLAAAMRASNTVVHAVHLDSEEGEEILLGIRDGDGLLHGGGVLQIPADTPENRRRASVTTCCPLCPDLNQGLMSQDIVLGSGAATYALAAYNDCGHEAAVRLDIPGPLYVLTGDQLLCVAPPER